MSCTRLFILILFSCMAHYSTAQTDTALQQLQQVPLKYIKQVDNKIDKYTSRITTKTEKTLSRLAKWENKIRAIVEKASPETAQRLFGNNQLTFTAALEKYKKGEAIITEQRARYNEYTDKLSTSLGYLENQKDNINTKLVAPVKAAKQKLDELQKQETETEAMAQFIKERRKQLIDQSLQYIGNSKWLQKISKENYYYVETLKNYKELFHNKKKAEETALTLLNKLPAFTRFMQEHSFLAKLFGSPSAGAASTASLAGLQTRASVNTLIQNQIAAGGPNAQQIIMQNMQQAQAELNSLKDKVLKTGGSSSDAAIPDFKPNQQKTKTLLQRLEFGNNLQFAKNNSLVPTTADIALSIGYKLNDKSVIGVGGSYRMGLGSLQRLSITHQGFGLRSYMDWKLKKQLFVSGGFEMNYNAQFKNIEQLKNYSNWQQAGLVGLTKKMNITTKWFKGSSLQILYDVMYRQHSPASQPVLFRIGYRFK